MDLLGVVDQPFQQRWQRVAEVFTGFVKVQRYSASDRTLDVHVSVVDVQPLEDVELLTADRARVEFTVG